MSVRFEPTFFGRPGTWVRAGLHCHTRESDGGLSAEATVQVYRERGYHCLGITDHRIVTPTSPFSDETFVGLDATENGGDPDIIGVGVTSAVPAQLPLAERARGLAVQGGFTIAAHPTHCRVLPDQYVNCPDLMALEICNAYCDEAYANGLATELWDMVLGQGKRIWGVASDDAHLNPKKRQYSDAGRGWVEVWAERLSSEAVLEALKQGTFYSSQGPRFTRIHAGEAGLRIECTPVAQVRWRTLGSVGFVDYPGDGESLTRSELPDWFRPNLFVRLELVDDCGRKAWSNPFYAI